MRTPQIDLDQLSMIRTAILIVQGDEDTVHVEHSAAGARTLPNGRLAVLPGSHLLPMESPQLLDPLIVAFLRARLPLSAEFNP